MERVTIRGEVLEHYCVHICQTRQDQCLALCPLRKVAEINRKMDQGQDLKDAARKTIYESNTRMNEINALHDRR